MEKLFSTLMKEKCLEKDEIYKILGGLQDLRFFAVIDLHIFLEGEGGGETRKLVFSDAD